MIDQYYTYLTYRQNLIIKCDINFIIRNLTETCIDNEVRNFVLLKLKGT